MDFTPKLSIVKSQQILVVLRTRVSFTALVGLFDRVGLRTNAGKTVSMVCHPCQVTAGNITQEA